MRFILLMFCARLALAENRNLVVITDLEPDDRIALNYLASRFPPEDIKFVGTTVMHAGRKQALVRHLLDQLGLTKVPVYQGTGGSAQSYSEIASSRAAREYTREGRGILSEEELNKVNASEPSSSSLREHIYQTLKKTKDVEFVVLAPPTDLVAVLEKHPELKANIKHIHIMGGWVEVPTPGNGATTTLRTTYNWNMGPEASAKLMKRQDIPMTVYSSHMLKSNFAGGSINQNNFPKLSSLIEKSRKVLPSLIDQGVAGTSWDSHLVEKIPPLKAVLGDNVGRQFTPADPMVMIGVARPEIITRSHSVTIDIDLGDLDPAKGFRVVVSDNPNSKIRLVDQVSPEIFESELMSGIAALPNLVSRRLNIPIPQLRRHCEALMAKMAHVQAAH